MRAPDGLTAAGGVDLARAAFAQQRRVRPGHNSKPVPFNIATPAKEPKPADAGDDADIASPTDLERSDPAEDAMKLKHGGKMRSD